MPDVFDEADFARLRQPRDADDATTAPLPTGARIGGAILLLNGVAQLSLRTLESSTAGAAALLGPWLASFDVVTGGVLLSGQSQVWRWVMVRLALGGVLLPIFHLLLGHGFSALLQLLFSAGLLLLLMRESGRIRGAAGVVAAGIAVILACYAVGPMLGLRNPFGYLMGRLNGEIAADVTQQLRGERVGYTLDFPSGAWHVLTETRREGAKASQAREDGFIEELSPAVRRPDAFLEVRLFALQVPPEASFDHERVITNLVEEARDGLPELLVVEDAWQTGAGGSTRVLEGRARIDGQRMGVALGFKLDGRCVFMLIGTVPPRMYPQVRDDLLTVFTSLSPYGC